MRRNKLKELEAAASEKWDLECCFSHKPVVLVTGKSK